MATYLKIEGISGNVTTEGYENWIIIDSFTFNVKKSVDTKVGLVFERNTHIPVFSELVITKKVDESSPILFSKTCDNSVKNEVYLDVCHTDSTHRRQIRCTMKNVILSDYTLDCVSPDNETNLVETISLSYTQIELSFIPVNSMGEALSPITAGYSLKQAQLV